MIMVILFGSLLVPVVILFALPLAIIDSFVALAVTSRATNIITGLAVSLQATALPVAVIAAGMWIAYSVGGGLYGVALVAAALLSMVGVVVDIDSYGPITDNASGIAEMAELPHEVPTITDALDAVGNTTPAAKSCRRSAILRLRGPGERRLA
jgi:K(+)-stimulated pyrophosphate-energized sodium pump